MTSGKHSVVNKKKKKPYKKLVMFLIYIGAVILPLLFLLLLKKFIDVLKLVLALSTEFKCKNFMKRLVSIFFQVHAWFQRQSG